MRFLKKKLQAAKNETLLRQFLFSKFTIPSLGIHGQLLDKTARQSFKVGVHSPALAYLRAT